MKSETHRHEDHVGALERRLDLGPALVGCFLRKETETSSPDFCKA
jgi:hypothetical protein